MPPDEGITVHDAAPLPSSGTPTGSPPASQRSPSSGPILAVVNGVLAGVGGIYVSTHSVLITVTAMVMAIALVVMVLIFQR